jgi:hypothetical protein
MKFLLVKGSSVYATVQVTVSRFNDCSGDNLPLGLRLELLAIPHPLITRYPMRKGYSRCMFTRTAAGLGKLFILSDSFGYTDNPFVNILHCKTAGSVKLPIK